MAPADDPAANIVPLSRRRQPVEDPGAGAFDAARPFGVYVHFPFCGVRCPYCDFAVDARTDLPHDAYADAVVRELQERAVWFTGKGGQRPELRSVYFGGGTPGLWRPDALGRVLRAARALGAGGAPREVTVEVNPGETDERHLAGLRAVGVDRISLGAQSFDDGELARLGRNHDAAAIPRAFAEARAAGFDNITVDLMFGVPGQTMASWRRSLAQLLALAPEHVSAYSLTIERGTRYFTEDKAGRLARPDDEVAAEMFEVGRATLAAAGFAHYEISSHARPGRRAVHNQLYWTQGAYLGVGASAASFRPLLPDGAGAAEGFRFSNPRATDVYLRQAASPAGVVPAKVERRTAPDLENEALWLALRTRDGVDRAHHRARFGRDPLDGEGRAVEAERCVRAGWLEVTAATVRLTDEGVLFADEVAGRLWGD
jgi:oxygen-independent coproporphyrinogen-3 oxidase